MIARRPASSATSSSFTVHALLAASVFAGALSLGACQAEEEDKKVAPPVGGAGTSSGSSGKGGTGGSSTGGAGTDGGGNAGGDTGSAGSGDTDPCGGTDAEISQVNNAAAEGAIKKDQRVKIKGAVVTSHKFLASASSCLWAVTITMPGAETQEYGSIQLTGKGNPAPIDDTGEKGACPMADGEAGTIPNDIKPGDTIDFTAYANEFIQASCGTDPNPKPAAGQKQLELGKLPAECFTRTPGDAVPAPHVFATTDEMTAFASGTNEGDVNYKWGAALITVKGPIKPKQSDKTTDYPSADAAVSKYGDMLLEGTSLAVNNNILYQDITGKGPKDSAKRVSWPLTTEFTSITGLGMVDFCSWSLSLRNQCGDAAPEATECAK